MSYTLSLEGRMAVVTGAGRGLGRAIARALAEAGAEVWAIARNGDELADLVAEVRADGGRAEPCPADLLSHDDVAEAILRITSAGPGVDILVNNAGINRKKAVLPLPPDGAGQPGSSDPSDAMTDQEWDDILDTHVRASLQLVRAFAPGMLERSWGRVVNIGSSAVGRSANLCVPYQVAKGTMDHLTRSLAKEWAAYGVTVNAIAPGQFRTSMTNALHDSLEGQAWLRERIPMRRTGDERELGALAVYLASDFASFVTGQTIYVDGGETL